MRRLIAAFKTSLDARIEGPQGYADWVEGWSEDYGLSPRIDACLLGGRMYPGYENYWTAIREAHGGPLPMTGNRPTAAEIEWGRLAAQIPHYVLSKTLSAAQWPNTRFLRNTGDVAALKRQPGKDIYLMGGAGVTASLLDAGLVDELRLIVYPLVASEGKALFSTIQARHALSVQKVDQLPGGRVRLAYAVG